MNPIKDDTQTLTEAQLKTKHAEENLTLSLGWATELDLLMKLMAWCFGATRPLRSTAFQDGARQLFLEKLNLTPRQNPFAAGSAQHDAWRAGVELAQIAHRHHLSRGLQE